MFAVIKLAGKQFVVSPEKKIKIDAKVDSKEKKLVISDVLLISDEGSLKIGKPLVGNTSVEMEIVEVIKSKKVLVVKHHAKKRYRRTKGHRQDQTILLVKKINLTKELQTVEKKVRTKKEKNVKAK
ncbi:MAG: large subunit ribosomal protein L21 [Candidatus Berkelbacteria bacterium Athens1014_28]|uniref:Large ribosomal subunit protein bL21 n=1 Tax=Candidatus Berkelbacteria bacterium Athens1014_28 TaxID=2017145 RepID=A0A554LNU7_9BACT|nr:MAG: large subunit ribosomal protein L21 [Candidatus Berkelbacteria bacterium Athens1014_28]